MSGKGRHVPEQTNSDPKPSLTEPSLERHFTPEGQPLTLLQDPSSRRDRSAPLPVLIHGFLETNSVWDVMRAAMPHEFSEFAAIALPAHGRRIGVAETRRLLSDDLFLRDYVAELRRICGPRRIRLVGHSTGGLVALKIAHMAPDFVHDALLVGGLYSGDLSGYRRWTTRLSLFAGIGRPAFRLGLKAWLSGNWSFARGMSLVTRVPLPAHAVPPAMRDELLSRDLDALREVLFWLVRSCMRDSLVDIRISVHCVIGRRDPVVPARHQLQMIARLPHATAVLMDTGHLPYLEEPEAFNEVLRAWMHRPESERTATASNSLRLQAAGGDQSRPTSAASSQPPPKKPPLQTA